MKVNFLLAQVEVLMDMNHLILVIYYLPVGQTMMLILTSSGTNFSLCHPLVPLRSVLTSTFSHGYNQKFNISWLRKYPELDCVFCAPCALFLPSIKCYLANKAIFKSHFFQNFIQHIKKNWCYLFLL